MVIKRLVMRELNYLLVPLIVRYRFIRKDARSSAIHGLIYTDQSVEILETRAVRTGDPRDISALEYMKTVNKLVEVYGAQGVNP